MAVSRRCRGILVIVGGILVHLSLGTVYTFGNMTPYVTSYIREYSSSTDLTYASSIWIFAMAGMGQGLSMFVGGMLCRKIGPRLTTLLGGWFMSLGVLLTYFTIKMSFAATVITYGLMFGMGVGIAYAIPIACAMSWLPERKGLVSGFVVAGFGGGSFIFDEIQTAFINPDNKSPKHEDDGVKYFTKDDCILDNVPSMFLLMGGCYAAMQLIGSLLLVFSPDMIENEEISVSYSADENGKSSTVQIKKDTNDEEEKALLDEASQEIDSQEIDSQEIDSEENLDHLEENHIAKQRAGDESTTLTPGEIIKKKSFYILWTIFLLNGQGITFISSLYKAYGQTFINDDFFLALVGAFAAIFNAAGRILWGYLADKTSFKIAMMCNSGTFTILMLTVGLTSIVGKAMFFVWVCLIFLTFSGNFSLMPAATARSFGQTHYAVNYGILFTSQVITNPVGAILTSQLKAVIGWYGMFFMVSAFSFASLLLTMMFNQKNFHGNDI